ncbi:hypothetical protein IGI39_003010 [Enterococcus sp. AZ135]
MVVSSIKPIRKSVKAYENYIFGEAHNERKERNLAIIGVGNCENINPHDMGEVLKCEREAFPSKSRKNDAYTLVIAFSDELDPNNSNDWKRAGNITKDIVKTAYSNRSAMIAVQRDGKSGLLHAHVLLNNVDNRGKALRQNGWKHLKRATDSIAKKYGLTPLTHEREPSTHYDWRRDLAFKVRETCGNSKALADLGITMRKRKSKKYPPSVTSYKFTDKDGKQRNIRGRQLASQLNLPDDYFDVAKLNQLKSQTQLVKEKPVTTQSKPQELVTQLIGGNNNGQDLVL